MALTHNDHACFSVSLRVNGKELKAATRILSILFGDNCCLFFPRTLEVRLSSTEYHSLMRFVAKLPLEQLCARTARRWDGVSSAFLLSDSGVVTSVAGSLLRSLAVGTL